MPRALNQGASHHAVPITHRFSNTGVTAGMANRFHVLSTPAASATSDMKPMYGNITRVITTAESNALSPEAIIHTSTGAATMPASVVSTSAQKSTVATASIRSRVGPSPSAARLEARMGTKACENAPSANSRRSRFGMRKATLNASVSALTPKLDATISSRPSPVTREMRVNNETVEAARSKFMDKSPKAWVRDGSADSACASGPQRNSESTS